MGKLTGMGSVQLSQSENLKTCFRQLHLPLDERISWPTLSTPPSSLTRWEIFH